MLPLYRRTIITGGAAPVSVSPPTICSAVTVGNGIAGNNLRIYSRDYQQDNSRYIDLASGFERLIRLNLLAPGPQDAQFSPANVAFYLYCDATGVVTLEWL